MPLGVSLRERAVTVIIHQLFTFLTTAAHLSVGTAIRPYGPMQQLILCTCCDVLCRLGRTKRAWVYACSSTPALNSRWPDALLVYNYKELCGSQTRGKDLIFQSPRHRRPHGKFWKTYFSV